MIPKQYALPHPPTLEIQRTSGKRADHHSRLTTLLQEHSKVKSTLVGVERQIDRIAIESICGENDLQQVETYDGTLGVTKEFVARWQSSIGQLQWIDNISSLFSDPGDSPGNVAGVRWGSGGLIADSTFITAGHCLDTYDDEWTTPRRANQFLKPSELSTLMQVNFNYQINGTTGVIQSTESFPVLELLEHRNGSLDYAILRLGRNNNGRSPGEVYGTLNVAENDLVEENSIICLIQHPNGEPKQIEAGPLRANSNGRVSYSSLDTLNGSSGAPLLSGRGDIIGVHTNGGCSRFNGFNYGVAIGAIRAVSHMLHDF